MVGGFKASIVTEIGGVLRGEGVCTTYPEGGGTRTRSGGWLNGVQEDNNRNELRLDILNDILQAT